jgi:LysM repeat protein
MSMATVMNSGKDPAELETLPEYIRESKGRSRETYEFTAPRYQTREIASDRYQSDIVATVDDSEPVAPVASSKGDMLETLWPGVHHELTQPAKRSGSFYLTIGFMAGAFISLIGVWVIGTVSPMVTSASKPAPATVTQSAKSSGAADQKGSGEAIVPLVSTYEVQSGDTLAKIAYQNYKHCSPRLLDEICQANKLASANVLNMGQKLVLPEYHPNQAKILATSTSSPVQ